MYFNIYPMKEWFTAFLWEIVSKNWHDNINTDPQCWYSEKKIKREIPNFSEQELLKSNAKIGIDLWACGISTLKCRGQFYATAKLLMIEF